MVCAYKSDLGVIFKNDEPDWLNYEECLSICAMASFKQKMGYSIIMYPKKFIEFIKYWSNNIENI